MYSDKGPAVRTELTSSMREDQRFNTSQYENHIRLINSLSYVQGIREDRPNLNGFWYVLRFRVDKLPR